MQLDGLVPRSLAANQFNPSSRAIQLVRKQFNQCLVRRRVHRRRGDFDFQFLAERPADFIFGGARLELNGKQNSAGRLAKEGHKSRKVEAIQVHHLVPSRDKVVDELLVSIGTSINFRQGAELGV